MNLKDYLLKNDIDPIEFAAKCKLHPSSIHRYRKGTIPHRRNAKIIERVTKGEVTALEIREEKWNKKTT
jgi:hypothetical protein